jgi:hypothetical protein
MLVCHIAIQKEDDERMISKKQIFAAAALIAIAVSTIAWAQGLAGYTFANITTSKIDSIRPPAIVVEPAMERTNVSYNAINATLYYNYTVIRVALTDLGGLYEGMKQFVVTFKSSDNNTIYAVLRLDEPVAEFVYGPVGAQAKVNQALPIDIVVSYVSKKVLPSSISYTISAEVVDVYGEKLG